MRSASVVDVVNCHASGEVGGVIVGAFTPPPVGTLWKQSR